MKQQARRRARSGQPGTARRGPDTGSPERAPAGSPFASAERPSAGSGSSLPERLPAGSASSPPPPTVTEQVTALVGELVLQLNHGNPATLIEPLRLLVGGAAPGWKDTVERVLEENLTSSVAGLWDRGWQPVDVLRMVARRLKAPPQQLVRAVIAEQMSRYADPTVDPRWSAQLAEAGVVVWWPGGLTAVQACAREHPAGWGDFVYGAVQLLNVLVGLPTLDILLPIPGTAVPARPDARGTVDERILARVRALLAKAESTTYPAEAETFTAGAQALMARHCIDQALLSATGQTPADGPTGRRIGIDNPYEGPKATLLDAVSSANRCRVVWAKHLGFATVVGYPADLDSVEILFTSLLVQAIGALTREGARRHGNGASRTRSFRQSFLLAFAHRIGERLTETTRQEARTAAAEAGNQNLLPVLASRSEAVEQATRAMFPRVTVRSSGTAWDHEGWVCGQAAADLATLTPATPVTG